jgi:hypothetical protein
MSHRVLQVLALHDGLGPPKYLGKLADASITRAHLAEGLSPYLATGDPAGEVEPAEVAIDALPVVRQPAAARLAVGAQLQRHAVGLMGPGEDLGVRGDLVRRGTLLPDQSAKASP